MFMPFQVLGMWIRGLLSLAIVAGGITLLSLWYANRERTVVERVVEAPVPPEARTEPYVADPDARGAVETTRVRVARWQFGLNRETAYLLGGLALLGCSLGGGRLFSPWLWRRSGGKEDPRQEHSHTAQQLRRPDGSELRITSYGPADGAPIVFTHGWGLDGNEWVYAKRELGAFRVVTWDLPGLGGSTRPADRDWSLEKLARDLDAVIASTGSKPVTLVGHSIGTMIILTYCKLFPEALGGRVERIVLAQGTYTNPVKTCARAWLYTALQKPMLEPLCRLMIWLSPLARVLNWLSYVNGSAHRSTERDSFSGNETRGQLDFITRYYCKAAPDVVGHGMLAMFRYDATEILERVTAPTLIVAGEKDPTATPEASRYMAKRIPHAELVILASAKHCGLFEWHEQFHEALIGFVANTENGSRNSKELGAPAPSAVVANYRN